jgi:hypothetical protein
MRQSGTEGAIFSLGSTPLRKVRIECVSRVGDVLIGPCNLQKMALTYLTRHESRSLPIRPAQVGNTARIISAAGP